MELQAQAIKAGSSPHSRGARGHDLRVVVGRGIIPAFAGSTPRHWRSVMPSEDHPRIRGEHLAIDKWADPSLGSSPHSRGALTSDAPARADWRIIPAFAGSTS